MVNLPLANSAVLFDVQLRPRLSMYTRWASSMQLPCSEFIIRSSCYCEVTRAEPRIVIELPSFLDTCGAGQPFATTVVVWKGRKQTSGGHADLRLGRSNSRQCLESHVQYGDCVLHNTVLQSTTN